MIDEHLNCSDVFKSRCTNSLGWQNSSRCYFSFTKKTTCKDLIFGPKYSFAVFDKSAIESDDFEEYLENLVTDIIAFNQKACSSPQVLFLEKSKLPIEEIAQMLSQKFEKIN